MVPIIVLSIILSCIFIILLFRISNKQTIINKHITQIEDDILKLSNNAKSFVATYTESHYKDVNRFKDITIKSEITNKKLNKLHDKFDRFINTLGIYKDKNKDNK